MGIEAVFSAAVSLALIVGSIWAGTRLVQKGVPSKGATGTLGSVLSMIEPATGAPTRMEAAAAIEEMRQRRHESRPQARARQAGKYSVEEWCCHGLPGSQQMATPKSETHSLC